MSDLSEQDAKEYLLKNGVPEEKHEKIIASVASSMENTFYHCLADYVDEHNGVERV